MEWIKTKLVVIGLLLSVMVYSQTGSWFYSPKDTFVEIKPKIWYNEATWTYIDSSHIYEALETFVRFADRYIKYCLADSMEVRNPSYESTYLRNGTWYSDFRETVKIPRSVPSFGGYIIWLNEQLNPPKE